MKKILLTALFIATLSGSALVSCSSDSESSVDVQNDSFNAALAQRDGDPDVKVTWKFGRRSRNCDGIGICRYESTTVGIGGVDIKVDEAIKQVQTTVKAIKASLRTAEGASTASKSIRIEFVDQPSADWAQRYFGGRAIILGEDFQFDTTAMGLDIVQNFTAPAGSYPITYDAESGLYGFTFVSTTR
jgi:hypothetical protein